MERYALWLLVLTLATNAVQPCVCQRLQQDQDNRYNDADGNGIRNSPGVASGQGGQYQRNVLGSDGMKNAGGSRMEVDPDLDYAIENAWLQGSEFEGAFENEEGDAASVQERERLKREAVAALFRGDDDYDDGEEVRKSSADGRQALDGKRMVDLDVDELIEKYEEENGKMTDGKRKSNGIDDGNGASAKRTSLPSFENNPMPVKLKYAEWKRANTKKERKKRSVPFELTSSLYLLPEVLQDSNYVASCLVVRDEHDYVTEWINHYLTLGVRPIYLYDHSSLPPLDAFLRRFINDGSLVYERLEYQQQEGALSPQLYAYQKCLDDHGSKHRWLTFFDVDEFLLFTGADPVRSLPAFLLDYEKYSALAIHWILFGSSEHNARPMKGVLRSYYRSMPLNHTQHLFVKTIVNTRCTVGPSDSPHSFRHNCSAPAVRADFSPIEGATASDLPVHDRVLIHHYATKSAEDFELKMLKGSGMRRQRGWEYFYFVDGWSTEFNFDGSKVWDSDVMSNSRALGPDVLDLQLAAYSKESLDNFWGSTNLQPLEDYEENSQKYDEQLTQQDVLDYDAEEGEW